MIRLLILLLSLSAPVHGQAILQRSGHLPVAASFRIRDAALSDLTRPGLLASLGDQRMHRFTPILNFSDSSGASVEIILADTGLSYVASECPVDGSPGIWFRSSSGTRHLFYLRDDHSLEWELILDSPTVVTTYQFPCRLTNVHAYYQPELTARELANGHERPDSIVGSYALYSRTGEKLLHIPRPRAFDADGNSAWCDLRIDSFLSITLPASFLSTARFPVRIDPAFGYSTAGASSLAAASIRCYANRNATYRYTASANQRVDSFRVHLRTLTGNSDTVDVALYSWNNGLQNRLDTAVWISTASSTAAWVSSAQIAQLLSNGTTYTLAINHHEGTPRISYDVGYSGDHSYDTVDDLPATWTEDGTGTYLISMQAWYSTISTSSTPTRRRRLP